MRAALAAVLVAVFVAACSSPAPNVAKFTATASGPAITSVAPDATALVDEWATAMGGRDALAAFGAVHGKGTYEKGGVRGTIELWQTASGARREEIQLGFLREVRIFDGTRGWLVDRNREVRELAGFEIDEQIAMAFVGTHAALVTDRRPGVVSRDGDKLVLAPDGGKRPVTVTIDRGTHLPMSYARRDGEKQRTMRLSDWNPVGAIKLPFSSTDENGNPNDTVTIHWKTLESRAPLADTFARPPDRETDVSLASDPVVVPIEVAFGGLIFVKVSINDTPMSFVLDTGAESTVLNSSRISKLGLQGFGMFATGAAGGDVVLSYVKGVTTKAGGATINDQIIAAVLLDPLEVTIKRPLDGILGYDFISRFVVELDYKNQTMRLYDRTKYHHAGAGKPIPITLEDSTSYFDASIDVPNQGSLPGHYVLDTGCLCEVQLSTPFVDEHKLLTAFPEAKQAGYSAGAGGTTHEVVATIPALRIGSEVIDKPRAAFSRDTHGSTASPELAGLIGSLVFKRFVLVLDYKGKQVFLDPLR